jgi:hypothetical protein
MSAGSVLGFIWLISSVVVVPLLVASIGVFDKKGEIVACFFGRLVVLEGWWFVYGVGKAGVFEVGGIF